MAKTVGIIGGLGPESTVDYYRRILLECRRRTGLANNPDINIVSVDIVKALAHVSSREYDKLEAMLLSSAARLNAAGSDFAAIASNTPHVVFDGIARHSPIPFVSIVESTCSFVKRRAYERPLLTGTLFTMREGFYREAAERYGIDLIVPSQEDMLTIHDVIFPELEEGIVVPEKKARFVEMVGRYVRERGIDCVILGCTELPLMIGEGDVTVPIVNTSEIHVNAIVDRMLA